MNREIIKQIQNLNEKYLARYMAYSIDHESVNEPSSDVPIWDKNQLTKYGLEYFDLVIANILLHRHADIRCDLTANLAELTTRLAYEGLRRIHVFDDDKTAKQFCEDIALHRAPNRYDFYQYLNYIERFDYNAMPVWFYYTLLLWAFIDTKKYNNTHLRSRFYVDFIHRCLLTKTSTYDADRYLDTFGIKKNIKMLLHLCITDKRFENDFEGWELYMIDSLRIFSIIIFSVICSRSMCWEYLTQIGKEVYSQRLSEHQNVIDTSYRQQTKINKGE